MTKVRLLVLLAVVALVLFPAIAYAQGSPPCRFHGTVQVSGANVADGTVITATIDGTDYSATTPSVYGASTFMIEIAQPQQGLSYDGKTVTFKIGNDTAGQTATWSMGGNKAVNLTKGTPPPTTGPGGGISDVKVTSLPAGSTPTVDFTNGVVTLGIPKGDKGDQGIQGIQGIQGETGKSASSVLGIVAIVLAVIAIIVAVVVMMRKPQKA